MIGKTIEGLGLPALQGELGDKKLAEGFATQRGNRFESSYAAADKTYYFHARLIPEFAPDHSVVSVMGVVRDITEQTLLQRRLEHLQTVTGELSKALTPSQVAQVIIAQGATMLHAST